MKNVLLVYKNSVYKSFFGRLRNKHRLKNLRSSELARFRETHKRHYRALAEVEKALHTRKIRYHKTHRGTQNDFSLYDLIVTVGGDGTFLKAAHHVDRQLILGVNSDPIWSVGRFCSATSRTFARFLDCILRNKFKVRKINRMLMKVKEDVSFNVLNDILVCHRNPAAMSRYYLTFKGVREEQRSSGVWIATAAGSTGAVHSAGGKVLSLNSAKLQYRPREQYHGCGRTYRLKGGLIAPNGKIKVTSFMRDGVIYVDGPHVKIPFSFGSEIVLQRSSQPLREVIL